MFHAAASVGNPVDMLAGRASHHYRRPRGDPGTTTRQVVAILVPPCDGSQSRRSRPIAEGARGVEASLLGVVASGGARRQLCAILRTRFESAAWRSGKVQGVPGNGSRRGTSPSDRFDRDPNPRDVEGLPHRGAVVTL